MRIIIASEVIPAQAGNQTKLRAYGNFLSIGSQTKFGMTQQKASR